MVVVVAGVGVALAAGQYACEAEPSTHHQHRHPSLPGDYQTHDHPVMQTRGPRKGLSPNAEHETPGFVRGCNRPGGVITLGWGHRYRAR